MSSNVDPKKLKELVNQKWNDEIIPALEAFIKVPAKSPAFDAKWAENGYLDQVVSDAVAWTKTQEIKGMHIEVMRLEKPDGSPRTPVIYFEIEPFNSTSSKTVLMYGHLDKQPEFSGWSEGLGPWTPKIIDDKLYGRGGADDGYAMYTSVGMVNILQQMGASHPRIVGVIETCEESGSADLPPYFDVLKERMGDVSMVVCLDSGAGNYDQLWMTNSLRGTVAGVLKVGVGTQGVHSGDASGLMPSSMRIMRILMARLEDIETGRLLPEDCQAEIPQKRLVETKATAGILGEDMIKGFPWSTGEDGSSVHATTNDPYEALLNRAWRGTLSVTGVDGIPSLDNAGNVLRPYTAMKLSLRMPPTVDAKKAGAEIKKILETNVPYNAKSTFTIQQANSGWNLGDYEPWLADTLQKASQLFYDAPCGYNGQGGSIPLINMLQTNFPTAQMLVCGVLGPNSNAHGPDEFLHLPYARKLTASIAMVLAAHP